MWSKSRAWRGVLREHARERPPDRARVGQIEHRAFEGRRRRRRHPENSAGAARQGAAAERALRASQSRISISRTRRCTSIRNCGRGRRRRMASGAPASARSDSAAPISTWCWRNTFRTGSPETASIRWRSREVPPAGVLPAAPEGSGQGRHTAARTCQGASARRAGDRRRLRGRTGRASARRPESRGGGPDAGACRAVRSGPARARTHRHRLCECRRTGGQVRQSAQGARVRPAGGVEGAARARHLPRPRPRAQGGIPLHRAGLAVRQHAAQPARGRADCGRAPSRRPTA